MLIPVGDGRLLMESEPDHRWQDMMNVDLVWIAPGCGLQRDPQLDWLLVSASSCEVPISSTGDFECQVPGINIGISPSMEHAINRLDRRAFPSTPAGGLGRLQRYYARMAEVRGYGTDDPLEGLLLLTEEVGELAHGIRKEIRLDRTHAYATELNVAEELADVQLFLLALANLLNKPLEEAVRRKERTNHSRAAYRFRPPEGRRDLGFIAIEGLIGAGKTTTATLLAEELKVRPVLERVESHPFLEAFYAEGMTHVLELELAFILMRWHGVRQGSDQPVIVTDFSPFKDLVFTDLLVADATERDLIQRMYGELWHKAQRPDLTIFLDLQPEDALARIQIRGRPYEQEIDVSYLRSLRATYLQNLEHLGSEVIRLDVAPGEDSAAVAQRTLAKIHAAGDLRSVV
jgi:deoxyadenosine/deoxycytidine kinase/NTP pyrophosphatase (non-canonical NTP hydrolase)